MSESRSELDKIEALVEAAVAKASGWTVINTPVTALNYMVLGGSAKQYALVHHLISPDGKPIQPKKIHPRHHKGRGSPTAHGRHHTSGGHGRGGGNRPHHPKSTAPHPFDATDLHWTNTPMAKPPATGSLTPVLVRTH